MRFVHRFVWSRVSITPLILAVSIAIGGCGSSADSTLAAEPGTGAGASKDRVLFDTDFEGVCSGAPVAAATAYDRSEPGIHPVLAFGTSSIDADDGKLYPVTVPEGFTRRFQADGNALAEIQLVACAKRTAEQKDKTCDGYQKDGVDTGQVIDSFRATYELSLYAATTGEKLDGKTVDLPAAECPTIVMSGRKADYPAVEDTVLEFVQPYVKIG
jgi:hypothetical protein